MNPLDRLAYVRGIYNSSGPGSSPDQTYGNTPSVFGSAYVSGYGQGAGAQGSVQATGILILVLLGVLVLAHRKLPMGV